MNNVTTPFPAAFHPIMREAEKIGFDLSCEPLTGILLRALAASKPGGRFLEIGTGAGTGTSFILDGMDTRSTLVTVEVNERYNAIAQKYLGSDKRVTFVTGSAEDVLTRGYSASFDFIFADTFPGKFYLLDETLTLLNGGGLYIVDDLLPQATWPDDHQANVTRLIEELEARRDLQTVKLHWASGLMICTKKVL